MNLYVATGNLTRDPEVRYTATGKTVTSFRIAINDGRGENRTTLFLNVEAWEKLGETVGEYCRKGSKVAVTGSLQPDEYTDRNKVEHKGVKISARNVEFLDRREASDPPPQPAVQDDDLTDLPF